MLEVRVLVLDVLGIVLEEVGIVVLEDGECYAGDWGLLCSIA